MCLTVWVIAVWSISILMVLVNYVKKSLTLRALMCFLNILSFTVSEKCCLSLRLPQLIKLLTASAIHGIMTSLAIIIAVPKTCIIILGFHYRWGTCLAWRVGGWQLIGLVDRARGTAWFVPLHKSMRMKVRTSWGWLIYISDWSANFASSHPWLNPEPYL